MENPQPEPLVVPPEDVPISPPPSPVYDYIPEPPPPIFKLSAAYVLLNLGYRLDVDEPP